MALANAYVQVYGKLSEVFQQLAQGQAPEKFTTQYLKDLGFSSTNFRSVIPLLKALGFLSDDGVPTSRYREYEKHSSIETSHGSRVAGRVWRPVHNKSKSCSFGPEADRR